MPGHLLDRRAISHAPKPDRLVVASRHRPGAIRREADGIDIVAMALQPVQHRLRLDIPDDGVMIPATRDQLFAIGREGQAIDRVLVALQQRPQLAAFEIVKADVPAARYGSGGLVRPSTRGKPASIGRKRHGQDFALVCRSGNAPDGSHGLPRAPVPDTNDLIVARRDDVLAVRREDEVPDKRHMPAGVELQDRPFLRRSTRTRHENAH